MGNRYIGVTPLRDGSVLREMVEREDEIFESESETADSETTEDGEDLEHVKTWHERVEVRLLGLRVLAFSRIRALYHNGRQKSKVAYV